MGGALLQKVDHDTMKFSMKACAAKVNNAWCDVYKNPITDQGKRSKKDRLAVVADIEKGFTTIREQALGNKENILQPVFRNGDVLKTYTFDEVRDNAQQ